MLALSRMKNFEHVEYHLSTLKHLQEEAKKYGILQKELLKAYNTAIMAEQELLGRSFHSDIVAEYQTADERRDRIYRHLRSEVKCLKYSDDEAIQTMLHNIGNPFKKLYNSRATKLARPKKALVYSIFAQTLRDYEHLLCRKSDLMLALQEFEVLNATCQRLDADRTNEKAAFTPGLMQNARKETDAIYRAISKLLESTRETYQIMGLSHEGIDHTLEIMQGIEKEKRKSLRIRKAWRRYKREKMSKEKNRVL